PLPPHPPQFVLELRRPPRPPLFPYTTLFRSTATVARAVRDDPDGARLSVIYRHALRALAADPLMRAFYTADSQILGDIVRRRGRSEEHTSELQSRENLVCRLLLEKKKISGMY